MPQHGPNRNTYKEIEHTNIKYLVGRFSPFRYVSEILSSYSSHLYNPPFTYVNVAIMDRVRFIKKLRDLEQKTDILRRIRKITNELKSNGAYSDKNQEMEFKQLQDVKASQDEFDILTETWNNKKRLCRQLWTELKELNEVLKKELDSDERRNDN